MKNWKKVIIMCVIFTTLFNVFITNFNYHPAYASSWTENLDKRSIYGKDEVVQPDKGFSLMDDFGDNKPGLLEDLLIILINGISGALLGLEDMMGISLNRIIYGRIDGNTHNGINLFRFELTTGNPYGIIGMSIYAVIAGIASLYIIMTILAKLSISSFTMNSGKKREELKSSVTTGILAVAFMILMPFIVDMALYLADITLSVVSTDVSRQLFADSNFNIRETFQTLAKTNIVCSLMNLSTVLLALWFAVMYVGMAVTMVILFICFPIICVAVNFSKKLLTEWVKQVFSVLITPVLDCILLMIPTFLATYVAKGGNSITISVVQVFVCFMMIPARNVIKKLLGVHDAGLGFAGVAALMGAVNLAKTAGGAIRERSQANKQAQNDENMANYYDEMSNNEQEGGDASGGTTGGGVPGGGVPGGGVSGGAMYSNTSSDVAEKYANASNFESPEFRGQLSNAKMADLYRQRASQTSRQANMKFKGAMLGGVIGAGAGMMLGPTASIYMAAGGMSLGGALGESIPTSFNRGNKSYSNSNIEEAFSHTDDIQTYGVMNVSSSEMAMGNSGVDFSTVRNNDSIEDIDMEANAIGNANMDVILDVSYNLTNDYTRNNGEKLHIEYDKMNKNDASCSSEEFMTEYQTKVKKDMYEEMKSGISNHNQYKSSTSETINQKMFDKIFSKLDKTLIEPGGLLNENTLKQYDWWKKN